MKKLHVLRCIAVSNPRSKSTLLMMFMALMTLMLLMTACSGNVLDSTGKTIDSVYVEYLNPPAEIDYEQAGGLEGQQYFLSRQLLMLNLVLNDFMRVLSNSDTPPTPESVTALLTSMPWLNGIAATDLEGFVLAQEPAVPIKQIDFTPLAALKPRLGFERAVQGFVAETVIGPELVATVPVHVDGVKQGFFAAHFDMGNLMQAVPARDYFAVFTPKSSLWEGSNFAGAELIRAKDWDAILDGQAFGTIEEGNNSYAWVSYFLGDVPLIFVLSPTAPIPVEIMPEDSTEAVEVEETVEVEASIE